MERSLLDSTLFQSDTIITSRGIQRRFQEAVKGRASKSGIEVDSKYWLLPDNETEPFIKFVQNHDYSEKNSSYSEKNSSYYEKNATNKSKVNKKKNNIYCASQMHDGQNQIHYGITLISAKNRIKNPRKSESENRGEKVAFHFWKIFYALFTNKTFHCILEVGKIFISKRSIPLG